VSLAQQKGAWLLSLFHDATPRPLKDMDVKHNQAALFGVMNRFDFHRCHSHCPTHCTKESANSKTEARSSVLVTIHPWVIWQGTISAHKKKQ